MSDIRRTALFAGAVVLAAGLGAVAGVAAPQLRDADAGAGHAEGHGHAHPAASAAPAAVTRAPSGLAVDDGEMGLRLVSTRVPAGESGRLRFAIVDATGRPVTGMDVAHERRMHVIVVRRDLTGFRHLHPSVDAGGEWSVPLAPMGAGAYRVFADFTHDGRGHTLSADLTVDGAMRTRPLPAAGDTARGDGRTARVIARDEGPHGVRLRYRVLADGRVATGIRPYLGAAAHVVVMREGDLAFVHAHADAVPGAPGELDVTVAVPSAGRYRVFLQLRDDGAVRTLAHTLGVVS